LFQISADSDTWAILYRVWGTR